MAAQPLLRLLAERFPQFRIVITTVTPTGAATVRRQLGDAVTHFYFPYDLPWAVRRFLQRVRPKLMIVMETELWPNFFSACRRAGVPLALVNARLSLRSLRRYQWVAGFARDTVQAASLISTQSKPDADRFIELGAPRERIEICGNLKFDLSLPHSVTEQGQAIRRFFSVDRPIWIGASTHQGEERLLIDAFRTVLLTHPKCLLILAPRHPERFGSVSQLCGRMRFQAIRRSDSGKGYGPGTQIFILDTLGELPIFYASADVAFVGGSLVPAGGHNVLEAACLGLPLVTGPHMYNFAEITELLDAAGALRIVDSVEQLARCVDELLCDANLRHSMGESSRSVFDRNQGSAQRIMRGLGGLITREPIAPTPAH